MCFISRRTIRIAENPSHDISGGLVGRHGSWAWMTRCPHGAFRTCRPHSASHALAPDKNTGICPFSLACILQGVSCNDKIWAHAVKPATWSLRLLQPPRRCYVADTARQQTVSLVTNGRKNVLVKGQRQVDLPQLRMVTFNSSKLMRQ